MRTCSLLCCLRAMSTIARGGQREYPENRWTQRERMHVPGDVRLSPSHLTLGLPAYDEQLRWLQHTAARPGIREAASSRFIRITSGAADDRSSTLPGAAPSPVIAREFSIRAAGRTNTINATTSKLAPFDTVHEIGCYGGRIHIFSYEHGRLIRRVTSRRVNGAWDLEGRAIFSYTPSGLLEKRSTFSNQYPYCKVVDSFRYDQEGRVVSVRNDTFEGLEEVPRWSNFDTTAYDDRGNQIYHRREDWNPTELTYGGECIVVITDTSTIWTSAELRDGAWVRTDRTSTYGSAASGRQTGYFQTWNGTTWVDMWMVVTIYDDEERPVHVGTYQLQNDTWVKVGRVSLGYSESGYSRDWDEWDGTAWIPFWQERCATDAMGRTLRYSWMLWEHGWIPFSTCTCEYGADGSIRTLDSSWTDGRLCAIGGSWTDASGRCLLSECVYQNSTDNAWEGTQQTTAYAPGGQELEVSYRSWAGGAWHPTRQYVFTYEGENRVRSVTMFEGRNDQWIASRDLRLSEPPTTRGGGWSFDSNDPMMAFDSFDELTFAYRPEVSDVGAIAGEKPEHSTLKQNHPNPFNPTTTIPFRVAAGGRTSITIFDVLGREVARPVNEWKDPGEYEVQFDASALASGMYVCRFTTGSVNQTAKMVLMR